MQPIDYRLLQEHEGEAAQAGMAKMMEQDFLAALALFLPLAEEGNAFALYDIGFMSCGLLELPLSESERSILVDDAELDQRFQEREEPLPDWARAEIKWYTRASTQGNPEAVFLLSALYRHFNLGALPWSALTGHLRELYRLAEQNGYMARGPALLDEIRAEMHKVGLTPITVFKVTQDISRQENDNAAKF